MRKMILKTVVPLACLFSTTLMARPLSLIDSTKINHTLDGNLNEWSAGKFETNKETNIAFAFDNDADNLYVAMKVPDPAMQSKIGMRGMQLFIDKKAKKRERTGIEFPVRKPGFGPVPSQPDPDKILANMVVLKLFGFDDIEDKTQFLGQENTADVAYMWDNTGVLTLEYKVPLKMIGETASLKGKPVSIGWKIAGPLSSGGGATSESGMTGAGSGGGRSSALSPGRSGGNRPAGGPSGGGPSMETVKEDNIWSTYTMNL